ncbi:MAG: carboxypeptidase-like regulatory domain-containing protein [bacterium]|nr:carboxypeptidase-like regulatory domain-containing protein [bacterium]
MKQAGIFLFLIIMICAAPVLQAQSGRAPVGGYISCSTCGYQGLAEARVELHRLYYPDKLVLKTKTDSSGIYKFDSVPMGDYIFKVIASGYVTYEIKMYIPSDSEVKFHVKLVKKQ